MNAFPGVNFPETWKTLVAAQGNTYYKAPPVIDSSQTNQSKREGNEWQKPALDATWKDWTATDQQTWVTW